MLPVFFMTTAVIREAYVRKEHLLQVKKFKLPIQKSIRYNSFL